MTYFTALLLLKILVSLVFVGIPFLLLSKDRLQIITRSTHENVLFYRLYGVAIMALLVAYGSAIPLAQQGHFSWGIAMMGLVSNLGGSTLLFHLGKGKQSMVLASFFGFITILLLFSMVFSDAVVTPIF
ncbi:hypothetical protein [Agaribacter marinus]|uniref:Uncharacterized protein n=1 Tax=Agaribacter marinus TaxID=1431249 RepID=A0AA37SXV9_9ALTE|nr:hypothetical protein [Agaribacter marinus]GLR70194.1 hypothetical protein GCM10007852_11020 [Agaribacter marinus]